MNDLGFYYIHILQAWYHIPSRKLIFMHEILDRTNDEIHALVFERTGGRVCIQTLPLNLSEWLISSLKEPMERLI